ncbi:putative ribonuclease H-like domain-containing protein [Tanacetum coccineum]
MCDVPLCENTTLLNALNEHSEIVVNSDDDNSSSDDDSPYEVVEIVDPEAERMDDDILSTIKDNTLREKLLNVNLLIAKIDALRDNPTPSSEVVIKSTSTFPNLFLRSTNTPISPDIKTLRSARIIQTEVSTSQASFWNPISKSNRANESSVSVVSSPVNTARTKDDDVNNTNIELKKVIQALTDPSWIEAMQDELLQFKLQKVWTLVDLPYGKRAIRTKWVYKNKKDEIVARIEAIRLFLAYASFMNFVVYQMDVKSAFLSTKKEFCNEFEKLMHKKFQMSSMGELTFFLGLQVTQKDDGIFISQDKYVDEILKKFGFSTVNTESTPIETSKPLLKDAEAEDVDVHLYRSMIRSLMYLTALRHNIMFAVCACARFQVTPKVSHLHAVKRIFRYLKGQPKLGFWYPKGSPFDLEAYTDSDYASASLDRKSITGGCQFLGSRLISWQCKKQTIVANSTTEAEYVAAASCCGQHIEIRHHFIRDSNEKKLIQMIKIHIDQNVADLITKALDVGRFQYLIATEYAQMMLEIAADDAIQVSTIGLTYYCHIQYALTENPTIYVSLIQQFWKTATASILDNGEMEITATIDGKVKIVTEASIRSHLKAQLFREFYQTETEVPQLNYPPHTNVANEAAYTGVDVRYGGVATAVIGLEA